MKKLLLFWFATLFLWSDYAASGPGWRGESKILALTINYHNQGVAVAFDNNVALNGCLSGNEIVINRNLSGYTEIYSTLLAAYVAKQSVNVWVSGVCENNRNVVTAIVIAQ